MSFPTEIKHEIDIPFKDGSPFFYALNKKVNENDFYNLAWHESMEIKYIVSGSLSINFGTHILKAEEGDIVVINPYEYHANLFESDSCVEYHLLCIDLSRIFNDATLKHGLFSSENLTVKFNNLIKNDYLIRKYADELFLALPKEDLLLSLGAFFSFFSVLKSYAHNKTKSVTNSKVSRHKEIMNIALSYMHSHFNEQIKLKTIAEKCFMSESHFCRVFKELTKETPISYINSLRINKALFLLESSDLLIRQIAEEVGFSEEAYFCRCFKKALGVSPKNYLNEKQKELKRR